jgi:hypothetical protein
MQSVKVGQLRRWKTSGYLFLLVGELPGNPDNSRSRDFVRWTFLIEDWSDWDFENDIVENSVVVSEAR